MIKHFIKRVNFHCIRRHIWRAVAKVEVNSRPWPLVSLSSMPWGTSCSSGRRVSCSGRPPGHRELCKYSHFDTSDGRVCCRGTLRLAVAEVEVNSRPCPLGSLSGMPWGTSCSSGRRVSCSGRPPGHRELCEFWHIHTFDGRVCLQGSLFVSLLPRSRSTHDLDLWVACQACHVAHAVARRGGYLAQDVLHDIANFAYFRKGHNQGHLEKLTLLSFCFVLISFCVPRLISQQIVNFHGTFHFLGVFSRSFFNRLRNVGFLKFQITHNTFFLANSLLSWDREMFELAIKVIKYQFFSLFRQKLILKVDLFTTHRWYAPFWFII